MGATGTHAAIEAVARHSYGRLIAYIAARSSDVAGAEDALGDAIAAALERWPADGVRDVDEVVGREVRVHGDADQAALRLGDGVDGEHRESVSPFQNLKSWLRGRARRATF